MSLRRASRLLTIVVCALPFAGGGCNTKSSSSDAALDAPKSTGGVATGGTLGTGGGSAGRGGGGAVNGGAGGNGGTGNTGGTTGSGGTAISGGSSGTTDTDGATGFGGTRDGGKPDVPGTTDTGGASALDAAVDGAELHCVGTPSNSYCPATDSSSCYKVLGCSMKVPTTGHCVGTPHDCSYNTTPASCAAQHGCAWPVDGGSSAVCAGTAAICGSTYDECQAAGCAYLQNDQYCSGTPTPCAQLSVADCTRQPGCALSAI